MLFLKGVIKIDKEYVYLPEWLAFIPREKYSKDLLEQIKQELPKNDSYNKSLEYLLNCEKRGFSAKNSLPIVGGVAVTNNCQLKCSYCINSSEQCEDSDTSIENVRTFAKYLCLNYKARTIIEKNNRTTTERGVIFHLTGGGESTSRWNHFYETVETVKETFQNYDVPVTLFMTTNGILNMNQIDYINKNIDSIMISYDGTDEIQNTNRRFFNGEKTSDIVKETIKAFDSTNQDYSIRSTLWHEQLYMMQNIAEELYSSYQNFQEWTVNPVNSVGRANNYTVNELISPESFLKTYISVREYINKVFSKDNYNVLFLQNSLCNIMCGCMNVDAPWLYPDGSLKICVDGADLSPIVGKIDHGNLEIYNEYENKLFKKYIQRFQSERCRSCIAYRFCAGGCPVKFMRTHTSSADWECGVIKAYWKYVFDEITSGKEKFGWKAVPCTINNLAKKGVLVLVNCNE